MRFRLTAVFYGTALIAASIAAFGSGGILAALIVLAIWGFTLSRKSRTEAMKAFGAILLFGLCIVCCFSGLFTVPSPREASRQAQCSNNMREIAHALRCYEAAWGCFPPAYVADDNGRPMHSWRVLILPYLEESRRYARYDFNEPWDGPNNRQLADDMPSIYRCPAQHGKNRQTATSYVAVVGPDTMWPGTGARKPAEVPDGLVNTVLLVEVAGPGVHWMAPRDLTVEEFLKIHTSHSGSPQTDIHRARGYFCYSCSWNAAFADGHMRKVSVPFSTEILSACLTVDGGESFDWESGAREPYVHWRWGRVVATVVFLVLCVLPLARLPWQDKSGVVQ